MSSFQGAVSESERASAATGLRKAGAGGDGWSAAHIPGEGEQYIVDAFTRLPLEDSASASGGRGEGRANPALGLRSTVPSGTSYFNTGIKSPPRAAGSSDLPGVQALPDACLAEQPLAFRGAALALPASAQLEVAELLKAAGNRVSIVLDKAAGAAAIHNQCNGKVSVMHISWDAFAPTAAAGAAKSSGFSAGFSSPSGGKTSSTPSVPLTQTGGTVYASLSGTALQHQPKEFRDAVGGVPKAVQDKVVELLGDKNNLVFLDLNMGDGKVSIVCKSGARTSTISASWTPGFSADHQYVPEAEPDMDQLAAAAATAVAAAASAPPASTTGGTVVGSVPGVPVLKQSAEFQHSFAALPKAVQDRVTELLTSPENNVFIDLSSNSGQAAIVCKCGLKTSTLKASWK
jgi:hypothetical protein